MTDTPAMKSEESELDGIWEDDRLDRRADADFLQTILLKRIEEPQQLKETGSLVLNLDAGWGRGKTFFLTRFAKQLDANGYVVASVDAWKEDFADDPMFAVMSAIDDAISPLISNSEELKTAWRHTKQTAARVAVAAAKGAAKHWAKKLIGDGVEEIANVLDKGDNKENSGSGTINSAGEEITTEVGNMLDLGGSLMMASYRQTKSSVAEFREEIASYLTSLENKGTRLPIFVFIDELDRCRPTYAISMLERVKHLFDISNIVFVVATDASQLQHSVRAVYGEGFDSPKYLQRFFDFRYELPYPSPAQFVETMFNRSPIDTTKIAIPRNLPLSDFMTAGYQHHSVSIRDIQRCHELVRTIVDVWKHKIQIEILALFPLVILHQAGLPIDLDGQVASRLSKHAMTNKLRGGWTIELMGRGQRENVDVSAILLSYEQQSRQSLPKISQNDWTSAADRWVLERYSDEFQRLHQGRYTEDGGPYSLVRQYPDLIRLAGRMTSGE